MIGSAFPNWDLVHPVARSQFQALSDALAAGFGRGETPTLFKPFELFRSPEDQLVAWRKGNSKARPWRSAHQYGLAVDFVPYIKGQWMWAQTADWDYLHRQALQRGLHHAIPWDKPHVEHPIFLKVQEVLQPAISGSLP